MFPRAAVPNYHKPGGSQQQKCILSQFRRPGVQNQGASRAGLLLKTPGESPSWLSPASEDSRHPWCSLPCTRITPIFASIFTWPFALQMCLCVSPLLIRTPVIGFRAYPNPVGPHLNHLHLQSPSFQIRPRAEVPGSVIFPHCRKRGISDLKDSRPEKVKRNR